MQDPAGGAVAGTERLESKRHPANRDRYLGSIGCCGNREELPPRQRQVRRLFEAPVAPTQSAVAPSTTVPTHVTPLVPNSGASPLPSTTTASGFGSGPPPSASGPLAAASTTKGSNIVFPIVLVLVLLVLVMVGLALFVNPGGDAPPAIADKRTYWYAGLSSSDNRILAASGRLIGRSHRFARTAWRRGFATATWLLGR